MSNRGRNLHRMVEGRGPSGLRGEAVGGCPKRRGHKIVTEALFVIVKRWTPSK